MQGERDGHITNGLTRRDDDGEIRRPHEATAEFIALMFTELDNGAIALRTDGTPEDIANQLNDLIAEKEENITEFFNSAPKSRRA